MRELGKDEAVFASLHSRVYCAIYVDGLSKPRQTLGGIRFSRSDLERKGPENNEDLMFIRL
jgi:hypothetical protein